MLEEMEVPGPGRPEGRVGAGWRGEGREATTESQRRRRDGGGWNVYESDEYWARRRSIVQKSSAPEARAREMWKVWECHIESDGAMAKWRGGLAHLNWFDKGLRTNIHDKK